MAKAKELTAERMDAEFETHVKRIVPKQSALGKIKGLAEVKSGAKAAGVPGWAVSLLLPLIEKWLREKGPEAIEFIIDWLKKRFATVV